MAHTGQSNPQAGIYRSDCGHHEITVPKGHVFPPCPHCNRSVNYTLVRASRY